MINTTIKAKDIMETILFIYNSQSPCLLGFHLPVQCILFPYEISVGAIGVGLGIQRCVVRRGNGYISNLSAGRKRARCVYAVAVCNACIQSARVIGA